MSPKLATVLFTFQVLYFCTQSCLDVTVVCTASLNWCEAVVYSTWCEQRQMFNYSFWVLSVVVAVLFFILVIVSECIHCMLNHFVVLYILGFFEVEVRWKYWIFMPLMLPDHILSAELYRKIRPLCLIFELRPSWLMLSYRKVFCLYQHKIWETPDSLSNHLLPRWYESDGLKLRRFNLNLTPFLPGQVISPAS